MAWAVHTIHTSLTMSVLTLLYSHVTTFHLHWPCLRDKNPEYGLDGTYTTVARAITAGRRALMFLRGMRKLVFCIVQCWCLKHYAKKLYFYDATMKYKKQSNHTTSRPMILCHTAVLHATPCQLQPIESQAGLETSQVSNDHET